MSKSEERLASAGVVIPDVPLPLAAYVPGLVSGNLAYTSGQLPMADGQLGFVQALIGDLDRVKRVIKVVGFVNSAADFEAQPKVINGASELLQLAFGEAGAHARSAVGVAALPLGAMCEVELIVEFE